jgi:hypothetical protein
VRFADVGAARQRAGQACIVRAQSAIAEEGGC